MTNPYRGLTLNQLYRACQERAGELLQKPGREPVRRTREERAALAQDTAYLLLAVASAVDPGDATPDTARWNMKYGGVGFVEAFTEQARRNITTARWRVIRDAADLVLGSNLSRMDAIIGGHPVYDRPYDSDAGLQRALEGLAREYAAREK